MLGGFSQLVQVLSDGLHVLTDQVVSHVSKTTAPAPSGTGGGRTVCSVRTRGGRTLEADYVVCTLPLGVLKGWSEESRVRFSPPLSRPKQQSIERLGYGAASVASF
jgi:monoamine oxidase